MDSSHGDGWGGRLALLVGASIDSLDGYRQLPVGASLEHVGDFVAEGAGSGPSDDGTAELNDGSWVQFRERASVMLCVREPGRSEMLSLQPAAAAARAGVLPDPEYQDPKVEIVGDAIYTRESGREPTVAALFSVTARVSWFL